MGFFNDSGWPPKLFNANCLKWLKNHWMNGAPYFETNCCDYMFEIWLTSGWTEHDMLTYVDNMEWTRVLNQQRSHMIHSNSVIFSNKISRYIEILTNKDAQPPSKTNYSRRICFFESFTGDNYGQLWMLNGRIYSCLRACWTKGEPKHRQEDVFLADTAKPISGSITTPVAFVGLTIPQSSHIRPYAIAIRSSAKRWDDLPISTIEYHLYIYIHTHIVLWYDLSIHTYIYIYTTFSYYR